MNLDPRLLIFLLLIGCCLAIFFEDLRSRSISIVWPIIIIVIAAISWVINPRPANLITLFQNSGYLTITFCITLLWLRLKKIGFSEALTSRFGLGDVVVSFVLTPFFSLPEFLVLVVFTSVWGLSLYWISIFKNKIPFAGLLSLGAVLVLFSRFISDSSFFLIPF